MEGTTKQSHVIKAGHHIQCIPNVAIAKWRLIWDEFQLQYRTLPLTQSSRSIVNLVSLEKWPAVAYQPHIYIIAIIIIIYYHILFQMYWPPIGNETLYEEFNVNLLLLIQCGWPVWPWPPKSRSNQTLLFLNHLWQLIWDRQTVKMYWSLKDNPYLKGKVKYCKFWMTDPREKSNLTLFQRSRSNWTSLFSESCMKLSGQKAF